MAQTLRFFPQQAVSGLGNGQDPVSIYSEIFDVSEYSEIEAELTLHSLNPTGSAITATIETCVNPNLEDGWGTASGGTASVSSYGSSDTASISGLLRFVRAKVNVPPERVAMITLEGVAKE